MVLREIISAAGGYGLELMVRKRFAKRAARGPAGAIKLVIRIIHAVGLERGFQASLVERAVVRHQGKAFDPRGNLFPYVGKEGGGGRILCPQSVDACVPIEIIVRFGVDEAVDAFGNLALAHDDHPDAAYAARFPVGGFKIDSGKVFHLALFDMV